MMASERKLKDPKQESHRCTILAAILSQLLGTGTERGVGFTALALRPPFSEATDALQRPTIFHWDLRMFPISHYAAAGHQVVGQDY